MSTDALATDALVTDAIKRALLRDYAAMHELLNDPLYTEIVLLAITNVPIEEQRAEYFGIIHELSRCKIDINIRIGQPSMPMISHVINNGQYVTCRFILNDTKTDIEATDLQGFTPLHHAALLGDLDILKLLLERGANMYAKTNDGTTALQLASDSEHTAVVNKLVKFDTRLRNLAFVMAAHDRLGTNASARMLSDDMKRKIARVAASDVGV
jgi:hypothetical protein